MTDRPPIYPSDSVPAPMDHVPGETEFLRAIRLDVEAQRRFEAAVSAFAPEGERVPSMVAGDYSPQDIANSRGGR